jgi:hypothetical protein
MIEVLHLEVLVYTRETGKTKPVCRRAVLDQKQVKRLLGFMRHNLHGGRIQLAKLPHEQEEKPLIIVP